MVNDHVGCTTIVTSKSFSARIPHSMNAQDLEMKTLPEYNYGFTLSFGDILVLEIAPRNVSFTVLSCSEASTFSLS